MEEDIAEEDEDETRDDWADRSGADAGVTRLGAVGFASSHAAPPSTRTTSSIGITKPRIGYSRNASHRELEGMPNNNARHGPNRPSSA
ncbi:MAG: hypothetical protein CL477_11225 [Acidobacteria bacterium]|nr:hypothetical protein [Acidobacteriota bacterium]